MQEIMESISKMNSLLSFVTMAALANVFLIGYNCLSDEICSLVTPLFHQCPVSTLSRIPDTSNRQNSVLALE